MTGTIMDRKVSNSEVGSWNTCKNKYRYEHDMGVQPKTKSAALSLGTACHMLLEKYYDVRLAGDNHAAGVANAASFLSEMINHDAAIAMRASEICYGYFAMYENDVWRIVAVEQEYTIPLTPEFSFTGKIDLVVEDLSDMGRLKIVDHKTTYDFWMQDDLDLNAQLPKYIGAARFNGIPAVGAIVNQLRTRKVTNAPKFERLEATYSDSLIRNAFQEQIVASEQIVEYRALPDPLRKRLAIRTLNKMTCKYCGVRSLCSAEWQGSDIGYLLQNDYELNSYDRNNAERVAANPTESADW